MLYSVPRWIKMTILRTSLCLAAVVALWASAKGEPVRSAVVVEHTFVYGHVQFGFIGHTIVFRNAHKLYLNLNFTAKCIKPSATEYWPGIATLSNQRKRSVPLLYVGFLGQDTLDITKDKLNVLVPVTEGVLDSPVLGYELVDSDFPLHVRLADGYTTTITLSSSRPLPPGHSCPKRPKGQIDVLSLTGQAPEVLLGVLPARNVRRRGRRPPEAAEQTRPWPRAA
jgi:hypothetical protein